LWCFTFVSFRAQASARVETFARLGAGLIRNVLFYFFYSLGRFWGRSFLESFDKVEKFLGRLSLRRMLLRLFGFFYSFLYLANLLGSVATTSSTFALAEKIRFFSFGCSHFRCIFLFVMCGLWTRHFFCLTDLRSLTCVRLSHKI
jgi:hypothetical protein